MHTRLRQSRSPIELAVLYGGLLALIVLGLSACTDATTNDTPATSEVANDSTVPAATDTTTDSPDVEIDEDVRAVFENFVQSEMPGFPIEDLQAAKDEGVVVFYTLPIADALVRSFEEVFPFVRVEMFTAPGGPTVERFLSEKRADAESGDVIAVAQTAIVQVQSEGFCDEYLPTSDDRFPDVAKTPSGQVYRLGGILLGQVFVPQRWENLAELAAAHEFWDTALTWEGLEGRHLGLIDVGKASAIAYADAAIYSEYGEGVFREQVDLVEQVHLYGGAVPAQQALMLGEVDIVQEAGIATSVELWNAGAPIGWIAPKPHIAAPYSACIATESAHPNAARLFFDFALSDTGQLSFVPGMISYKEGLDLEAAVPENLLNEPWYVPLDASNMMTLEADEAGPVIDEFWPIKQEIFGTLSD